jgi:hypothetical protein
MVRLDLTQESPKFMYRLRQQWQAGGSRREGKSAVQQATEAMAAVQCAQCAVYNVHIVYDVLPDTLVKELLQAC